MNEDGTVVFKNAYSNTYLAKYTSSVGSISIENLSIKKNGTAKTFVNLSNPNDVVNNLEFTFYLPDGIELESAKVAGRANGSHSISYTVFFNGGVVNEQELCYCCEGSVNLFAKSRSCCFHPLCRGA